jgi:Protein of unknown function, DUF547
MRHSVLTLTTLLSFWLTVSFAQPSHDAWHALLQKHVTTAGTVNYKAFKADAGALSLYLDSLAAKPPQDNWTRADKMAYWLNAYNAFTIKLIVDNYPVSSITKLHKGKPWDVKWIKLGEKTYSLNDIENDIIRPKFKDARIHFALNCAAKSCPPLWNQAFTAQNLEKALTDRTRRFVRSTKANVLSASAVQVSKIFEWYRQDFGDLIVFINRYSVVKVNAGATVTFQEYDWSLNE